MQTGMRILVLLATWLFAAHVQAIQISSAGDTWTADWSYSLGTAGTLSATSTWTVLSFSDDAIELGIEITNTTSLTGLLTNADITTFGFGITPDATATFLAEGSTFDEVGSGSGPHQTFPGGFKQIDVCIFSSNCSGGSVNSALHAGESDSLQLLLSGAFDGGFADLLYFPIKFQTNLGSYEVGGCIDGNNCNSVPEPPVIALLGLGLLLIVLGQHIGGRFMAARQQS